MNGVRIWLHTDKYVKENPGEKKIYTKEIMTSLAQQSLHLQGS